MKSDRDTELRKQLFIKQFQMVGRVYSPEETSKDLWFRSSSWTPQQKAEFDAWAIPKICKTLKCNKDRARSELSWYHLSWGWTEKA